MRSASSHRSPLSCANHHLSLTENGINGVSMYQYNFSRICAITQIKYVLVKLCQLPQHSYGSRDPNASYPDLGRRDPYSSWGKSHSMATHTYSIGYISSHSHSLLCCGQYSCRGKSHSMATHTKSIGYISSLLTPCFVVVNIHAEASHTVWQSILNL